MGMRWSTVVTAHTARAALLCLLVLAWACTPGCGEVPSPTRPSIVPPLVPPQPPSNAPRMISIGEEVNDTLTFHGDKRVFELTASSDGTLVARVTWDRRRGLLELMLGDKRFGPSAPEASVGTLVVVAAQRYRMSIADGAPWDYDDLFVPFVLTTSIQ
jgi:hypothetical protein